MKNFSKIYQICHEISAQGSFQFTTSISTNRKEYNFEAPLLHPNLKAGKLLHRWEKSLLLGIAGANNLNQV